jgi:hypothetical protein
MKSLLSAIQLADEWRAYAPDRLQRLAAVLDETGGHEGSSPVGVDLALVRDALHGVAGEALDGRSRSGLITWLLWTRRNLLLASFVLSRTAHETTMCALRGTLLLVAHELRALAADAKQLATALVFCAQPGAA